MPRLLMNLIYPFLLLAILDSLAGSHAQVESCISQEQFLASISSRYRDVLVFVADVIQIPQRSMTGQQSVYVRISKILRQPKTGWQVAPGNVGYVKEIQTRPMDPDNCIPRLVKGNSYLWVTQSVPVHRGNSADGSLRLVPGGIFISPAASRPPDACSNVMCHYGSTCQVWTTDRSKAPIGVCVCPGLEELKTGGMCNADKVPVCADNGQVYENECVMVFTACIQHVDLKMVKLSPNAQRADLPMECRIAAAYSPQDSEDRPVQQPPSIPFERERELDRPQHDAAFTRGDGSHHHSSSRFNRHPCQLTVPCPTLVSPVCGSNRLVYQNDCLFRQAACDTVLGYLSQSPMALCTQPSGIADVTASLCAAGNLCLFGSKCETSSRSTHSEVGYTGTIAMHQTGGPGQCSCHHVDCLGHWPDPVCADDGETYSNECFLRRRACEQQSAIAVLYRGTCAANPCLGYKCRWAGERCQVDKNGMAKCACPSACPNVVIPVCGNDGVTYENHCQLQRTACLKMRNIWVIYAGQCGDHEKCRQLGVHCKGYEICTQSSLVTMQSSRNVRLPEDNAWEMAISCVCPECPQQAIGDQVCGSDGQTYRSECHLRTSACQRQANNLTVVSRGYCDVCKTKKCRFHSVCRLNRLGEPECICPTGCLYVRKPVCGTDGNMYENECFLKVKSCAEQQEIHVAQEGPCLSCPQGCPLGYQCRNGECVCREVCPKPRLLAIEVCGTNGQVYTSECELKRTACLQGQQIDVDSSGVACRNRLVAEGGDHILPQADSVNPSQPTCSCNKFGAWSEHCDHLGRCRCRWGVSGEKCDHCMPGYWGIGNGQECISCSCHPHGAVGTGCDQTTGQCQCRRGAVGRQCSICPKANQWLTEDGCVPVTGDARNLSNPNSERQGHMASGSAAENPGVSTLKPGRRFAAQTTMFARAPFALLQPFVIHLGVSLARQSLVEGEIRAVLHHRMAPSLQESLLQSNPKERQLSLLIIDGHLVFNYTDGQTNGRSFVIRSHQSLKSNTEHSIKLGVRDSQPWLYLDNVEGETLVQNTGDRGQIASVFEVSPNPSAENYGTLVIGKPVAADHVSSGGPSSPTSFEGCLFKLLVESGDQSAIPEQRHQKEINLIEVDPSELAWLGAPRGLTGPQQAPLCEKTHLLSIQSDEDETVRQSCQDDSNCQNNGVCLMGQTGLRDCLCQPGWQGNRCEQEVSIIPQFDGAGYIRLLGPSGNQAMKRRQLHLELVFWANEQPGLLLYIPPRSTENGVLVDSGPFIALYLDRQSRLVVVCRVGPPGGSSPLKRGTNVVTMLSYSSPTTLKQWHTVTINKKVKQIELRVDGGAVERMKLVPPDFVNHPRQLRKILTAFDLSNSPVYFGGYPFGAYPSPHLQITSGLKGAIQKVNINGADVVLAGPHHVNLMTAPGVQSALGSVPALDPEEANSEQWLRVSQWQGPPCGPLHTPCQPAAVNNICRPQKQSAVCACTTPVQLLQMVREQPGGENIEHAEGRACARRRMDQSRGSVLTGTGHKNDAVQHDQIVSPRIDTPDQQGRTKLNGIFSIGVNAIESCGSLPIKFEGKNAFKLRGLPRSKESYNVRFRMRTTTSDGLVFAVLPSQRDAPITVLVARKGVVEFRIVRQSHDEQYSGSRLDNLIFLRSNIRIDDGLCHTVQIFRNLHRASLIVDDRMISDNFRERSDSAMGGLTITQFGGTTSELVDLPWEYQQNFTGCISEVLIDERPVPLLTAAFEIRGPISPCT